MKQALEKNRLEIGERRMTGKLISKAIEKPVMRQKNIP